MEIYRNAGIEADIRARDVTRQLRVSRAHEEPGGRGGLVAGHPMDDTTDMSPTTAATCDRDQLEPILRAHAERQGADVRFNTELVSLRRRPTKCARAFAIDRQEE